ncbi:hypothetical protein VNO78_16586 [Psophocarpus tetragonolobus]|uniref:Uncharacterized protein n=1 Tax=Psophocarpus tetragonolobus TaxID=3891 RepID=A0AAN9XK80_PSOTE
MQQVKGHIQYIKPTMTYGLCYGDYHKFEELQTRTPQVDMIWFNIVLRSEESLNVENDSSIRLIYSGAFHIGIVFFSSLFITVSMVI